MGVQGQKWCGMGEGVMGYLQGQKVVDVRPRGVRPVLLHSDPMAVSYDQILPSGFCEWYRIRLELWRTSDVLFTKYDSNICQSIHQVGDHRMSALKDSSVCLVFQRTSILKDKSIRLPTLAYVRSKSPILQNDLVTDPSDPMSKLTLVTKLFTPS